MNLKRSLAVTVALALAALIAVRFAGAGQEDERDAPAGSQPEIAELAARVDLLRIRRDVARAELERALNRLERFEFMASTSPLTDLGKVAFLTESITGNTGDGTGVVDALSAAASLGIDPEGEEFKTAAASDAVNLEAQFRAGVQKQEQRFVERSVELTRVEEELAVAAADR